MTRLITIGLFALLITSLYQCKKSESKELTQIGITYPEVGLYGHNILQLPDSSIVKLDSTYSLTANLENYASLKVVFTKLNERNWSGWFYALGTNINWQVSTFNSETNQQTFTSNDDGVLDLQLMFSDTTGRFRIDYFENSATSATASKTIFYNKIITSH